MAVKSDNMIRKLLSGAFCIAYMLLSAYAGMQFTGKLAFQIILTFSLSLVFTAIADFFKIKTSVLSFAACVSTAFWVMYAVICQMLLKGTVLIFNSTWEYMFYYDKIGMVFIVLIVVTAYQRIKAFIKKNAEITEQYEKFYSVVSVAFVLFYILVLIYCFFLCRTPGTDRSEPNFDPLDVFRVTFFSGGLDYERLVLFFGNIAIFIPLGYLLYRRLSRGWRKLILVFFPVVLSSSIELSQYYFAMGHPDVDDIILNVIGFYIGASLKALFDKAFNVTYLSTKKEDPLRRQR